MRWMTGYGWGECAQDGLKVTVEISSVNRRQSEISVNLPRGTPQGKRIATRIRIYSY
jgi:uncharacterized protein YicC (UPF0701 family)